MRAATRSREQEDLDLVAARVRLARMVIDIERAVTAFYRAALDARLLGHDGVTTDQWDEATFAALEALGFDVCASIEQGEPVPAAKALKAVGS